VRGKGWNDGPLVLRTGNERKFDEGAGKNSGIGFAGKLFKHARCGATVAGDVIAVIAGFPFRGIHYLVAAAGEPAVRATGSVWKVAVLRPDITILGRIQFAVPAENRVESGPSGNGEDDVGCDGSLRAGRSASVGIVQVAVVALLTRFRLAVAAHEKGKQASTAVRG